MIINEEKIFQALETAESASVERIREVLNKAREKKGLTPEEAACLLRPMGSELEEEFFAAAARIKEAIYGERLVFFAPLYISDYCVNDCQYCNFHISNKTLERRKLSLEDLKEQTRLLIAMGHKRLLLEFGEDPAQNSIDYVVGTIESIYSVKTDKGNIRRLNVNIAATSVENYRKLKSARIGTYQLFQETYHRATYQKLHQGPKQDYQRQLSAHNRAFQAGIDDLGLGVLFGLYDWRFEVLALISHAQYLERTFGVGPHTISVPRFCPGSSVSYQPRYPVSDADFLKLIAVLRVSVPYTGMILSTRERPELRKMAFKIGISQASAGSAAATLGYGKNTAQQGQFQLRDSRSLYEVVAGALDHKLLPSFCTACYRKARTGTAFMDLAKPGAIHHFCRPNGILSFAEYLEDFCANGIYEKGQELIRFYIDKIEDEALRRETCERLLEIKQGKRDLYF